jgi:hypothetical protein
MVFALLIGSSSKADDDSDAWRQQLWVSEGVFGQVLTQYPAERRED